MGKLSKNIDGFVPCPTKYCNGFITSWIASGCPLCHGTKLVTAQQRALWVMKNVKETQDDNRKIRRYAKFQERVLGDIVCALSIPKEVLVNPETSQKIASDEARKRYMERFTND